VLSRTYRTLLISQQRRDDLIRPVLSRSPITRDTCSRLVPTQRAISSCVGGRSMTAGPDLTPFDTHEPV